MMKGTPCSRGNYAPLKDPSSKTRIGIEVQGLGPWRGLGQRPNLACCIGRWFGSRSITHPQHQSREAGSCSGAKRPLASNITDQAIIDQRWLKGKLSVSGRLEA